MNEKGDVFVIAPTDGGFRVYSPANITRIFMVSGIPDWPQCNCADFEAKKSDPEWRCTHISAVLSQLKKREPLGPKVETKETQQPPDAEPKTNEPAEKKKSKLPRNGQHSQMMIKRSVSPDGKINSLSVEFLSPVDGVGDEEIKRQAEKALKLETDIVDDFLKRNRNRRPDSQPQENPGSAGNPNGGGQANAGPSANGADGAVPAQLLNVAGMNTRSGWKLFINVQVDGITTKLFGNKRELGEFITAAGFASIADHISQGMMLNLPCRVVTKRSQDGRYLNIDRVLPLKPLDPSGRAGQ